MSAEELGHDVGAHEYGALAWFTTSLATVGGALGAGLESDEALPEAATPSRCPMAPLPARSSPRV